VSRSVCDIIWIQTFYGYSARASVDFQVCIYLNIDIYVISEYAYTANCQPNIYSISICNGITYINRNGGRNKQTNTQNRHKS